jgi:tetratricopeptide (TPR) repeat protein
LLLRAINIQEEALGSEHPRLATTLDHLAYLYGTQGKYEEAEALYKRGLDILQRSLKPDHPNISETIQKLGWINFKAGRCGSLSGKIIIHNNTVYNS